MHDRPKTDHKASEQLRVTRGRFLGAGAATLLGASMVGRLSGQARAAVSNNAPAGALDWVKPGLIPNLSAEHPYPFSFVYDGVVSDSLLATWEQHVNVATAGSRRTTSVTWRAPDGLKVRCDYLEFLDQYRGALDWVLWFSNPASKDSAIISDIQALDLRFSNPIPSGPKSPYTLHRTNGDNFYLINGPYGHGANPASIFQPRTVVINSQTDAADSSLTAAYGWPSFKDLPFYKLEGADGSLIVGLGWSGQWNGSLVTGDNEQIRLQAGMEQTNFLLHGGEAAVRSPRVLIHWTQYGQGGDGPDTLDANANFRQLIYAHYQAPWGPEPIRPLVYATDSLSTASRTDRPGACDWDKYQGFSAAGEISLLNAFKPLTLDIYIQDATWYTGPYGGQAGSNCPDIGQWDVRTTGTAPYPQGLAQVSDQAQANGLTVGHGVWFEAESARGPLTYLADPSKHGGQNWLLGSAGTYLVNFGIPGVIDYLVGKLQAFAEGSPGYRAYWQDSNNVGGARDPDPPLIDELRYNEPSNRQGINEIRHVMGMYEYWGRLAKLVDGRLLRKECAGGGRRIDLETVKHMHFHQTSDSTGGNPSMDQTAIWGLSQYLPNSAFDMFAPYGSVYRFDSGIAATQNLSWDPQATSFDMALAKQIRARHDLVSDCVTGPWYPLTDPPSGSDDTAWVASQYQAGDEDRGVVLAYRRGSAPQPAQHVVLRGLAPGVGVHYQLHDADGRFADLVLSGKSLMSSGLWITLASQPASAIIAYSHTTVPVTPVGFLSFVLPDAEPQLLEQAPAQIAVAARYNLDAPTQASLQLAAPDGWTVDPPSVSQTLPAGAGSPLFETFTVTPPAGSLGRPELKVVANALGGTQQAQLPVVVSTPIAVVGTKDGSAHEFALYPDQWPQYLSTFPNGVDFTYGSSDPAKDWCYIQPGPDDAWGGGKPVTFTFHFALGEVPNGDLAFTVWLVDTNPSVSDSVDVGLNGSTVQTVTLSPGGGQGAWGLQPEIPSTFTVNLPTNGLNTGQNAVSITITEGAWIVYDAFGVFEQPA